MNSTLLRKEIIQREREKTENEIEGFRNEEMSKMNKEINELTSNKALEEQLLSQHKSAIDKIENDYKANKDKAVTFLVNALMEVDLIIPDVVIGKFSHKLILNKGK